MKAKQIKHTGKDVTKYGLSAIIHSLTTKARRCKKSKALLEQLFASYPDLQHAKVRTGREVILHNLFPKAERKTRSQSGLIQAQP